MARRRTERSVEEKILELWLPILMRGGGVFIAIYAALVHDFDRPSLYVLAFGMMTGEPVVSRWLRSRTGNGS